jgi:histidyl-tRNA synthetase
MEGGDVPSVGAALGLERLIQAMLEQHPDMSKKRGPDVWIIVLTQEGQTPGIQLSFDLRRLDKIVKIDFSHNLQKSLKNASGQQCSFCLILGEEELQEGVWQVKNMATRETLAIAHTEIISWMLQNTI